MRLDPKKFESVMASKGLTFTAIAQNKNKSKDWAHSHLKKSKLGMNIMPRAAGLLAEAMGVELAEIIVSEEPQRKAQRAA